MTIPGMSRARSTMYCVLVVIVLLGNVCESAPWKMSDSDRAYVSVQPTRPTHSDIYRWLIQLISRKDLFSWINFHVHPHEQRTSHISTPGRTVESSKAVVSPPPDLQIQRDTDDLGQLPVVGPGDVTGLTQETTPAIPSLVIEKDVDGTATTAVPLILSNDNIVTNGIPMVILSGNTLIDRISGNSHPQTTGNTATTPQMIRDTFNGDSAPQGDLTSIPENLIIVRDKDSDSSNSNESMTSSSQITTSSTPETSSSSGLLILNPANGFNFGK